MIAAHTARKRAAALATAICRPPCHCYKVSARRSPQELIDAIELRFLLIAAINSPCSPPHPHQRRYAANVAPLSAC